MSGLNVCVLVDSNLKRLRIGIDCARIAPYMRCNGDVVCSYTVDRRFPGWPDISVVKDKQYSDLVVALGMNHCKIGGENQRVAMRELEGYFVSLRSACPDIRLYYVMVPPSYDSRINKNINVFNRVLCEKVVDIGVHIVRIPSHFYDDSGKLKADCARQSELRPGYRGHMLHLNCSAQNKLCFVLIRVISKVSRQRLR